jgi:hypothetical protein
MDSHFPHDMQFFKWVSVRKSKIQFGIAGHRHRSRCSRHRHSDILYLSPVPEHSGTGLGPLIPVTYWLWHRNFCSFRYRTDRMPDSPTFRLWWWWWWKGNPVHVQTGSGKWYTLYVQRQLLMVLFLLYDTGIVFFCNFGVASRYISS